MHSTNKAFERCFDMESDDLRNIYEDASTNVSQRRKAVELRKQVRQ